ncbi:MAG: YihA family ribosome biogenesis GTP-binding protein [Thiomargarita sp.]|nr:YihA family ribosome biogenesis GTP-binding protein [Thiomargarita sp.]
MSSSPYRQAKYWISAHKISQLPEDIGFEVAFAGRSNAGKSSAINVIADQKKLAYTSKTPGRTQQIIFFELDETRRLVDLPGYGFAKVPMSVKQHWQKTLASYLQIRQSLQGLILMMDIRHPLTEFDQQMLEWCNYVKMPVHILLTKADKISYSKGQLVLKKVSQQLAKSFSEEIGIQLFSALKRKGIETAHQRLNDWFKY